MNRLRAVRASLFSRIESRFQIVIGISALFCLLFNLHTYFFEPSSNPALAAGAIFTGFLFSGAYFLMLSLNRYVFLALVPLTFMVCSVGSYFVYTFEITITQNILGLVFDTNPEETGALLGVDFYAWTGVHMAVSLVPAVLFFRRGGLPPGSVKRAVSMLLVLLVMAVLLIVTVPHRRLPREMSRRDLVFSAVHSLVGYRKSLRQFAVPKTDISKGDFRYTNHDLVVVLILGEGARADHFHINGYNRRTSPNLERLKVVSFTGAMSSFSFTRKSVPCILTRATAKNYELSLRETGLISIFRRLGFYTAWISNQRQSHDNHDTPITVFAREADAVVFNNRLRADSYDRVRLDEELLKYMDDVLDLGYPNKLIVLHTIGSHWNYNAHYPQEFMKYTPIARNSNPYRNSAEEIVNSYDNTILYTDHFIAQVMERVKGHNSLVVYVSDHGEFLGEKGRFSHPPGSVSGKELFHIPLFVWASQRFSRENPEKMAAVRRNSAKPISHDHVFHSLLDGAGIVSPIVEPGLSLFRDCLNRPACTQNQPSSAPR